MYLADLPEAPVIAVFTISDVVVNEQFPDLHVDVLVNGEKVDQWVLGPSRITYERRLLLSPELLARRRPLEVSFHIATPRSPAELHWSDDARPLGFRLTRFQTYPSQAPSYRLGQIIDFTEGGNAEGFLGEAWSTPDQYGRWTLGREARLALRLDQCPNGPVLASFLVSDCMVSEEAPALPINVVVNGQMIEEWILGPSREVHERRLLLSPDVLAGGEVMILFQVPTPRSPASLGWSGDVRPLGLRLTKASLESQGAV
jgi:hypothetical protein